MKKQTPLHPKYLRKTLKLSQFGFKTTADLESLTEFVGQERALEAIDFGINIRSHGYNLYAMGPSGIGKRSMIRTVLEAHAIKQFTPCDWCYIYNFDAPEKPQALKLPHGTGYILQQDMKAFVEELATSLLAMFESDEYRESLQKINDTFNSRRENYSKKITETIKIPRLYKERLNNEKELLLTFSTAAVEPLIRKVKLKYEAYPEVIDYLSAAQTDIINHVNELIRHDEITNIASFPMENPGLLKYQVNLLVDNSDLNGAPVVFEDNPSYSNLISRVEHILQLGSLVTNFTLIRAGSLHRANGGYLIIEARKLKKEKLVWEYLKRALYAQQIIIEPIEHLSESARPISLEPIPIPLNIKIILLGDRRTFYSLLNHDPDFSELFKVAVDFDEDLKCTNKNLKLYARLIGTIAFREGLKPFHVSAVAAIIAQSIRLTEDIDKLTTNIRSIDDLILEANYWATIKEKLIVDADDVKKAIAAQIHRLDRSRDIYQEEIQRNFIIIHTKNKLVGQINCLSVIKVGKFSYGHPTRITAKVSIGKGKIIDIQREIRMAGPIHTKGGLTIANFLASRYNKNHLFSLFASISFEQIYGNIEGDSASVAELCALLSALADVPIKQSLAVTGSIDQYGQVQAIGGVNEKIEGFFDICRAKGFTKNQGVLIPAINRKNLMLREDVVAAAKEKKFFVYLINTIDEAITLLTGIDAGTQNVKGDFTKNSINDKVAKRLEEFAKERLQK